VVVLVVLNACHRGPEVAQAKGGCWEVVTAVGWMACREHTATALEHSGPAVLTLLCADAVA
jgi:hypothetical protein